MLRHALTGKVGAPWIPAHKRSIDRDRGALRTLAGYALLLLASLAHSTSAILLWDLGYSRVLFGQMILAAVSVCGTHRMRAARAAPSRTPAPLTPAAFIKWFAWNMPYHVEHHAYPSVPFHALPKLNRIVADEIVFQGRGYRAVTRETWAWFRRTRQAA